MPQATRQVEHNEKARQFELRLPGGLALLRYSREGNQLDLLHTSVPTEEEEAGHGTALVRAAVEHARRTNQRIVPTCPFVKAYLEKNPGDEDVVVRG